MSDASASLRERLPPWAAPVARALRLPALLLLIYLLLRALLAATSGHGGLLTPEGQVSAGLLVLGALVLGLRLVVLTVVPALLIYRVGSSVLELRRDRDRGGERAGDPR
jgi:hypothetical protein